jgi:hypothetical protein
MFKRKRFLITFDFEKRAKARRQVDRHARGAISSALAGFCKRPIGGFFSGFRWPSRGKNLGTAAQARDFRQPR